MLSCACSICNSPLLPKRLPVAANPFQRSVQTERQATSYHAAAAVYGTAHALGGAAADDVDSRTLPANVPPGTGWVGRETGLPSASPQRPYRSLNVGYLGFTLVALHEGGRGKSVRGQPSPLLAWLKCCITPPPVKVVGSGGCTLCTENKLAAQGVFA